MVFFLFLSFGEKSIAMQDKGEIILYQPDRNTQLKVRLENENVWLNRHQMAELFGRDIKTIGKHVNNALKEELANMPVVANFATTATDGKTYSVEYYNLDMILSVGYRIKSQRGILFRQWANRVLKDYLLKGYAINQRLERIESRIESQQTMLNEHSEKIEFFLRTTLPPLEGVFFDGQVFDAHRFASDLIRNAKRRIILIDNYIDDTVLNLLDKRGEHVEATIYTRQTSPALQNDIDLHNTQYSPVSVHTFTNAHDRFMLIDDAVYHIGASLKDLGKKWFAFSRIEMGAEWLMEKLWGVLE